MSFKEMKETALNIYLKVPKNPLFVQNCSIMQQNLTLNLNNTRSQWEQARLLTYKFKIIGRSST